MPWALLEFIWRRKYHGDPLGGLLKTLRDVSYIRNTSNPPFFTEMIIEQETEQHESETEIPSRYDNNSEEITSSDSETDTMSESEDEEYVEPSDTANNLSTVPFVILRRSSRNRN